MSQAALRSEFLVSAKADSRSSFCLTNERRAKVREAAFGTSAR